MKIFATLLFWLGLGTSAWAATLLPNGEQTFLDANGNPLVGGTVMFYNPSTTVPKNTYKDPDSVTPNTNPVVLDGAGRAIIYGSGAYRQIVKDRNGNLIWDQLTADNSNGNNSYGGLSTGTGNAQDVMASNFSYQSGQSITFTAGWTNSGPMTLSVSGGPATPVVKDTGSGPLALSGGEVVAGNIVTVVYNSTDGSFHLVSYPAASHTSATVLSATTVDLGLFSSHNVLITGTNAITSFGNSASLTEPYYNLKFNAALVLTYNTVSLQIPGNSNLTTASGDTAVAMYLGSGNWQIVQYTKANGNVTRTLPLATSAADGFMSAADKAALWKTFAAMNPTQSTLSGSMPNSTIPTITDGDEVLSLTFTPSSTTGIYLLTFTGDLTNNVVADHQVTAALFCGNTFLNAASTRFSTTASNSVAMQAVYTPAVTTPITCTVRTGSSGGTSYLINGNPPGGKSIVLTARQVSP